MSKTAIAQMKQELITRGLSKESLENLSDKQIEKKYNAICKKLSESLSGSEQKSEDLMSNLSDKKTEYEKMLIEHNKHVDELIANGDYVKAIWEFLNPPKNPNILIGTPPDVILGCGAGAVSLSKSLLDILKNPKQLLKLAKSAKKEAIKSFDELSAFLKSKISNMKLNPKSFKGKKPKIKAPYIGSPKAAALSKSYNETDVIYYDKKIVDGFRDGGRGSMIDKWGKPISANREIITIDRELDQYLTNAINYAKNASRGMSEEQKVKFLYDMILKISGNAEKSLAKSRELAKQYCDSEILLGEVFEKGAASCRHKALMFKILADEIGLNAKMVRGVSADAFGQGGHVWNEIKLSNGKKFLVDTQNSHLIDLAQPSKSSRNILKSYFYRGENPY